MVDSNETNRCDAEIFSILSSQAGANAFMVVVGAFGLWGCGTILFTYCVFRDFRSKSYFFLGGMAMANFVDCFGLAMLGLVRLTQLLTCSDPAISPLVCLLILTPYWMGYTCSVAFDFIVAVDRLTYLYKPEYYRLKLGIKYTVFMTILASVPTLFIETPSFFALPNGTHVKADLCSEGDPTIRTNAHMIADYVNVVLVCATASMYLTLAAESKRPFVRKATKVMSKTSVPHELNFHMTRFVLMQRRVLRVSVASAISSLFTNGMYLVAKLIMEATLSPENLVRYIPYVSLPLLCNAAGSIFFAIWRDHIFKKRFICVIKSCYGLRRHTIRQFQLGLSVTVLDKKM